MKRDLTAVRKEVISLKHSVVVQELEFVINLVLSLSGNTLRVSYHLCIRHTLGTVVELQQSSENTHRFCHIIKKQNTYRLSYAVFYYSILVIWVFLKTFVDI